MVVPEEYGQLALLELSGQLAEAVIGELRRAVIQELLADQCCIVGNREREQTVRVNTEREYETWRSEMDLHLPGWR